MEQGARLALIEVLDQDGRVQHAVPVTRWPVSVGRALECDVVLHDPHVAARHATLDAPADGAPGVRLTVGSSINGVRWRGGRLAAGASASLPTGVVWHAGRSALRVRLPGEALALEQPLAHPAWRRRALLTLAGGAALLLWAGALLWLDNDPGARWDQYVPVLLGMVFGAAVWCALWGLGSKLFQRRFAFMPHLRVLLAFALAALAIDALLALGSFALSWPALSHVRAWVGWGVAAAWLARHASLLLPGRERAVGLLFTALCLLAIGINAALDWRRGERLFSELYAATLPPPALRLARALPASTLIDELRPLKAQLDRRAREDEDKGTEAMVDGDSE